MVQNNISEKRAILQVKAINKWIEQPNQKSWVAEMIANKLTILRRDFIAGLEKAEGQEQNQEKVKKVTQTNTPFESRACLDGKLIFLVLAHAENCDELERLIKS